MLSQDLSEQPWIVYLLLSPILYVVGITAYRLFLHPLRNVPGPWLAAIGYEYGFWYNVWKGRSGGRYITRIAEMHQRYGNIVRVAPNEVHINDPHFFDFVYSDGQKKSRRDPEAVARYGIHTATIAAVDTDKHESTRTPFLGYFSSSRITNLEVQLNINTQALCDLVLTAKAVQAPINLVRAYSCLVTENLTTCFFDLSAGFLENADFSHCARDGIVKNHEYTRNTTHPSFLPSFAVKSVDGLLEYMQLQNSMTRSVNATIQQNDSNTLPPPASHNIFQHLIANASLPADLRQGTHLRAEGKSLIDHGIEPIAWTLTVITTHLLLQPRLLRILLSELRPYVLDPQHLPPASTLSRLPYLSAVISEGLRLSYGIAAPSPRVFSEPLVYPSKTKTHYGGMLVRETVIPKGAKVSMFPVLLHHSKDVFPERGKFRPERWLKNGRYDDGLEKYLLTFGRGETACVGKSFVIAQLYIAVAALSLRVLPRATLFETTVKDVQFDHEALFPLPYDGSKGVRVKLE